MRTGRKCIVSDIERIFPTEKYALILFRHIPYQINNLLHLHF